MIVLSFVLFVQSVSLSKAIADEAIEYASLTLRMVVGGTGSLVDCNNIFLLSQEIAIMAIRNIIPRRIIVRIVLYPHKLTEFSQKYNT